MYEEALRKKYRFNSPQGLLSVEDLWDLPLKGRGNNLDNIAKELVRSLREEGEQSLVDPDANSFAAKLLTKKLEIVKHIIDVKLEEREATNQAAAKATQKQQLLEILHQKKNDALKSLSIEELEAQINSL